MKDQKIKTLVSMAFFTAVTFLGIQAFRIPVPAVVGTPFIHFGHVFVVMGMLLQGGKKGAVTGTAGLLIFDLLNGYVQSIPQVFCGDDCQVSFGGSAVRLVPETCGR